MLVNPSANLSTLPGFPLLYPNAGVVDDRYYAATVLTDLNPSWYSNGKISLPPAFGWGSRIMGTAGVGALPGVPNQVFPGYLNINRTQDFAVSLTKVWGTHTSKAGFYNNHSFKAQNTGAGGVANLGFQGYVNFGNDTNNALDTGFGYANAAVGVFQQYLQQSKLIEGSMIYNNTEFYVQDNWKVNGRLTLDYGVRFTRQQPQYDQFLQMSNFFPDEWSKANAPLLYVSGCNNGAIVCSGNARNAVDPRTGQILTAPGAANTAAAIGTVIPGTGSLTNGIHQAGNGIADTSYVWPMLAAAPRFGMAYDLKGDQTMVLRAGGGLYYDRPDGNTVFSIPGNPPISTSQDLRNGQLQTLGTGLSTTGVPALIDFQYNAQLPSSWQWQAGVQTALPWSMMVDVAYVGNHGFNRVRAFQGGAGGAVDLNAIDIGAAYLPQEPGSDARPERRARRVGVHVEPAARVHRLQQHQRAGNEVLGRVPRDPDVVEPSPPQRPGVRHQLLARPVVQGQHRSADAPAARRRRHDLAALGSGAVRGAEREPRDAEARDQELCGVGHPERAVGVGQGGRDPAERLAAVRRPHGRLGVPARRDPGQRQRAGEPGSRLQRGRAQQRPLRPRLHVPEQRRRA